MTSKATTWNTQQGNWRGIGFLLFVTMFCIVSVHAQSLQKVGGWEFEKHEFMIDLFEREEGGFLGLSLVQYDELPGKNSPKQITLWNWDENFKLIQKQNYAIDWVQKDGFDFLGRSSRAKSGGWYVLHDKLTRGSMEAKFRTELRVLKLTYDGKIEQSPAYSTDYDRDVQQVHRRYQFSNYGHLAPSYSAYSFSENRAYILLATVFMPGELAYTLLDSSLKQVSQGIFQLGDKDANIANETRWSLIVDGQGTVHCFTTKWANKEPGPMTLTLAPLNGAQRSYPIQHSAYQAFPSATFLCNHERRYTLVYQTKDPKAKEANPYADFQQFALKDDQFLPIDDVFSSSSQSPTNFSLHRLWNSDQGSADFLMVYPDIRSESGANYDIWALVIRKGLIVGERVIPRRLGLESWGDYQSQVSVKKNGNLYLLFESQDDREDGRVSRMNKKSSLYMQPVTTKEPAIRLAETSELGLFLSKSVQCGEERMVILGVKDELFSIYTLPL